MKITYEMQEAAAMAIIKCMFPPHELPLDEDTWNKYLETAYAALRAAQDAET